MHKRNEDGKIYHGGWQQGSVIQQKLDGPIGDGSIDYPNGDRFEGSFHLSYAHINGPAYMADGTYTFANGDRIEHCWIDGNDALYGVYETLHADGTRSIAMWYKGKRVGLEIEVDRKTCNYRERGFLVHSFSQLNFNYTYTPGNNGFNRLEVTLYNGMRLVHWFKNNDNEPDLFCELYYPDGDWMEYWGWNDLKEFRPWDGVFTYHRCADGMKKYDTWKNGTPQEQYDHNTWEHDEHGARRIHVELDPYGNPFGHDILLWPDGHTQWGYGYHYEGTQQDGIPEGRGVFYDDSGRRYEGLFHKGLCHGEGTYTFGDIVQSGRWEQGRFLDGKEPAAPVMLKVHWTHTHCSPSGEFPDGEEEWTIEAKPGELNLPKYTSGITIELLEPDRIILSSYGQRLKTLTPGKTVGFLDEVEGREYSDGIVYESDEYNTKITWLT
ncbi:MAG: hypothetical protein IJ524_02730 [Bacteroidales bacterium]|nr:hypothetical protein [Bacteroidales bacterium]